MIRIVDTEQVQAVIKAFKSIGDAFSLLEKIIVETIGPFLQERKRRKKEKYIKRYKRRRIS